MAQGIAVEGADAPRRSAEPAGRWLLLFTAFAAVAFLVYRAALHGPFLSDDFGYIVTNPYTSGLGPANLRAILDPFGPARLYTANYAPVHLLLTALERQIFADDPFGYHVVNLLLHATNTTLLVALLRRSGLPMAGAVAAGGVFLVHPANVEAVAWISSSRACWRSPSRSARCSAHPRRPAAAAALFALGLLSKASGGLVWRYAPRPGARLYRGRRAPRGRLARAVGTRSSSSRCRSSRPSRAPARRSPPRSPVRASSCARSPRSARAIS
jgi:hypothetical protein